MKKQLMPIQQKLTVIRVETLFDVFLPWAPTIPVRVLVDESGAKLSPALDGCQKPILTQTPFGPRLMVAKDAISISIPLDLLIITFNESVLATP